MDDYLAKPVRPDELRSTLARHLGGNGAGVDDPHAVRAVRAGQTAADDAPIVDIGRLRDLGVVGEEDLLARIDGAFGTTIGELRALARRPTGPAGTPEPDPKVVA